jgi:hypothetical protein
MSKYLPERPFWDALVRFKRMEANLGASIRCPEGYTSVDEHEDLVRRDELFQKWRGRPPPLTGEEDAEEAHLFARIAAFKQETVRVSTARLTSGGGGPNAYLHLPIPRPSAAGFRRLPPSPH